jgi:signal transduction histidine kinase
MHSTQDSIYSIILIGFTLGISLIGFIVSLLYLYEKRQKRFVEAIEKIKQDYAKTLLETRVEIQEEAMNLIARELHDDLATTLSLINIHLVIMQPEKVEETKEKVNQIRELNMYVLNKMRSFSHLLNSDLIEQKGFAKVFHLLLDNVSKIKTLELQVDITGEEFRFDAGRETIVFRICQEVINNILKHARAKTIKVNVDYLDETLNIDIRDDGIGFDPDEFDSETSSTGWLNIKSRARMINALVHIQSQKGKGQH